MIIKEIKYCDPIYYFYPFIENEGSILLDSGNSNDELNRYSFIAIDPVDKLVFKNNLTYFNGVQSALDPFDILQAILKNYFVEKQEGFPPFQGGIAGYFSYDLCRYFEKIPPHKIDDMFFPDMALAIYDVVIAFDHHQKKAWLFSSGYPEKEKKEEKALSRLKEFEKKLLISPIKKDTFVTCEIENIISNFEKKHYCEAIQKTRNYILEGDIFQANISQRFLTKLPHHLSGFDLFRRLKKYNPSPFSAYIKQDDITIVSSSPERFLKKENKIIEARPIKGTRPRGKTKEEDDRLAKALLSSEKDLAENSMIVDLMRNDLSRVCDDDSVKVKKLCGLESFPTVHHLVSVIEGKLSDGKNAIDLIKATFPGGSVTGAPKVRAMEIIAEIEPTARGPYCGSIGYIGFNGDMDLSITIRTFLLKDNDISFQVGGAVVLDSEPEKEYEESLHKAYALKKVLTENN